jgi:hypothetical protein
MDCLGLSQGLAVQDLAEARICHKGIILISSLQGNKPVKKGDNAIEAAIFSSGETSTLSASWL